MFAEAYDLLRKEYNCTTRQSRTATISTVTASYKCSNEKKISVSEELKFLKGRIIKFSVQGSPNRKGDLDLVKYLQNDIAGLEWAQTSISQRAAADVPRNIQRF